MQFLKSAKQVKLYARFCLRPLSSRNTTTSFSRTTPLVFMTYYTSHQLWIYWLWQLGRLPARNVNDLSWIVEHKANDGTFANGCRSEGTCTVGHTLRCGCFPPAFAALLIQHYIMFSRNNVYLAFHRSEYANMRIWISHQTNLEDIDV